MTDVQATPERNETREREAGPQQDQAQTAKSEPVKMAEDSGKAPDPERADHGETANEEGVKPAFKTEGHAPYAPPHRRKGSPEGSREHVVKEPGPRQEATVGVEGSGNGFKRQEKKEKGVPAPEPVVKSSDSDDIGGPPLPKRERKPKGGGAAAAAAGVEAEGSGSTEAHVDSKRLNGYKKDKGFVGSKSRPAPTSKALFPAKAPSGGGGPPAGGAVAERASSSSRDAGADNVLIVFEVSMGEQESHRVEYRKGQDFTEVVRSFCRRHNLLDEYAPRLEAYLRARAPPGVFPPKARGPPQPVQPSSGGAGSGGVGTQVAAPKAPLQQPHAGGGPAPAPPPQDQPRAPVAAPPVKPSREVMTTGGAEKGGRWPGRERGERSSWSAEAAGAKPLDKRQQPSYPAAAQDGQQRGRSRERAGKSAAVGGSSPSEQQGQARPWSRNQQQGGSRGPPPPQRASSKGGVPPATVKEFLRQAQAPSWLDEQMEKEGFVGMDSLLELARDKKDFKDQLGSWGVKKGEVYDLLGKLRPWL